jgi:phosphatidylserine decarboxylase
MIIVTYFYPILIFKIISIILGIIFIFNFYFLRDPERKIPEGVNLILSPADGTIIKIDEVFEPDFFGTNVQRVSIFLSIFNVHVNRIPISGKIEYLKYVKGKFFAAFADKASEENEQTIIGIKNNHGKLLFKQIAGIIARRIIFKLKKGETVNAGARFGLIMYGSRVDMFIPTTVNLKINLHDKVLGGETVIGEFN